MRLEYYSEEKLRKELKDIIGKQLDLRSYRLFFFGSRAAGKGTDRSDIDVGIEGPREIPLEIMARLKEALENLPLLYKVELVDFKNAPEDFRKIALQSIEPIL